MAQTIMWLLFIGPWFLLLLFDTERLKRFFPVGVFAALILTIVFQIAERFNWWVIKENIFFLTNVTPFVYGAFLVGTVLIFYFSYPSFTRYMIFNIVFDLLQAFVMHPLFIWAGIYEERSIHSIGLFFLMLSIAVILYLYQKWQETIFK
jgi:hypothetical protein